MTIPRDRTAYSAIVDRPPLPPLPGVLHWNGAQILDWYSHVVDAAVA